MWVFGVLCLHFSTGFVIKAKIEANIVWGEKEREEMEGEGECVLRSKSFQSSPSIKSTRFCSLKISHQYTVTRKIIFPLSHRLSYRTDRGFLFDSEKMPGLFISHIKAKNESRRSITTLVLHPHRMKLIGSREQVLGNSGNISWRRLKKP